MFHYFVGECTLLMSESETLKEVIKWSPFHLNPLFVAVMNPDVSYMFSSNMRVIPERPNRLRKVPCDF